MNIIKWSALIFIYLCNYVNKHFPNVKDLGRSPGEGNGNPLQYSCLDNSMDRGAWQAIAHGVPKSQTHLSNSHTHTHTHTQRDHRRPPTALELVRKQEWAHHHSLLFSLTLEIEDFLLDISSHPLFILSYPKFIIYIYIINIYKYIYRINIYI